MELWTDLPHMGATGAVWPCCRLRLLGGTGSGTDNGLVVAEE